MIVFPAIDIINGQCVRLVRGDYATASKVAEDPLETAKRFEAAGAEYISKGYISDQTTQALSVPMIPEEIYMRFANGEKH